MKNKLVCPRLLTATDTITDRENIERVLTTQRHFRTSDCSKQRCMGNRDILSSVFELRYQIIRDQPNSRFHGRDIFREIGRLP